VVVRVAFHRLNPEYGELTMEHQETILPVPQCLEETLRESILPKAHRDDAVEFRQKVMSMSDVTQVLSDSKPQLQAWFATIPLDENQRVGIEQWVTTLNALNVIGTFTCLQGSDVVGDDKVGTEFKCRLSVPQAKSAFVNAQRDSTGAVEDTSLDFEELLEAIARCGVDKYRSIDQINTADKVKAMIANILGDANEEQVVTDATYIKADRFPVPETSPHGPEWLATWSELQLHTLQGFPLWESGVFDVLAANVESLRSIFAAYSASGLDGPASEMDLEEFHDFVIEADLITDTYGFDTMSGQFTKAAGDASLNFTEFMTMIVKISFFRANPQYGMRKGDSRKKQANVGANEANADKFGEEVPLPDCLQEMLSEKVLPNSRSESYARQFEEETLPQADVQSEIGTHADALSVFYETISAGRDFLELDQWIGALEGKMLFSNLTIDGYVVRLAEPMARAAFYWAASTPDKGLMPDELAKCVARCGYDKYRQVTPMAAGTKVSAFLRNLLEDEDEEEAVQSSTGGKHKDEA